MLADMPRAAIPSTARKACPWASEASEGPDWHVGERPGRDQNSLPQMLPAIRSAAHAGDFWAIVARIIGILDIGFRKKCSYSHLITLLFS